MFISPCRAVKKRPLFGSYDPLTTIVGKYGQSLGNQCNKHGFGGSCRILPYQCPRRHQQPYLPEVAEEV